MQVENPSIAKIAGEGACDPQLLKFTGKSACATQKMKMVPNKKRGRLFLRPLN
jgi:hypothetical protein